MGKVCVRLFGLLGGHIGNKSSIDIYFDNQSYSVKELMEKIGVPVEEVGFITINGEIRSLDHTLKDNDEVLIFPFIIGG